MEKKIYYVWHNGDRDCEGEPLLQTFFNSKEEALKGLKDEINDSGVGELHEYKIVEFTVTKQFNIKTGLVEIEG